MNKEEMMALIEKFLDYADQEVGWENDNGGYVISVSDLYRVVKRFVNKENKDEA